MIKILTEPIPLWYALTILILWKTGEGLARQYEKYKTRFFTMTLPKETKKGDILFLRHCHVKVMDNGEPEGDHYVFKLKIIK